MTLTVVSTETDDKPTGKLSPDEKLQRFRDWLKTCQEAEASQRTREQEDLRFQVGEDQWTQEAKEERAGRPMLSISLIAQPMQLVSNQAASAKLGVTLTPVSETATNELAEIKQGLYQRIQRDGGADQARLWGLDRAKQCGRGWYRIITQYDEDSDNPSDQEIAYQRILYQDMVYADPAAEKPDYSDARFIFVAGYMTCEAFRALYPGAKEYTYNDFLMMEESAPGWVKTDGKRKDPLVAEVFYKVSVPEVKTIPGTDYKRQSQRLEVWRAVVTGREIIEDEPWQDGGIRNIPLIPVIGRELQPVDGQRRWEGMVRPASDGQRTFNYAISSLVEDISRLSKAPYIGVEGQFAGHEDQWRDINRKNVPYVEYAPVALDGKPAPAPAPMQIDGTKMGLSLQLAQEAKSLVQVATAVYEPSLGESEQGKKGQSGRAIIALQQQADAGTGNYIGNLGSISLPYEARVVLELIPRIYDRAGRVTRILGGEDESKTVMLNAPHVMQGDRPVQIMPPPPGMPPVQGMKEYNLAEGKYSIAVSIGKSAQTRLQQGADEIGQILSSDPTLMAVIGDIYFRFRDFPGHTEIADRLAKLREKVNPGLGEDKDGQPSPGQLQAQVAALQQQLQEAQAQLAEAAEAIKTDKAKQEATIQKAAMDAQAKQQAAAVDASSKQAQTEMDARLQVMLEQMQQSADTRAAALQAALDIKLERMKEEHEMRLEQFKAAHEVGMGAAGGRTATITRDRGQETGQEQESEQSQGESESQERSAEKRPDGKSGESS